MKLSKDVRDIVRAMVRNHPGFESFRAANGNFASRDLTTELTLKAVADLGMDADLQEILDNESSGVAASSMAAIAANCRKEEEKLPSAWIAGPASSGMAETDRAETVLGPLRPFLSPVLLDTVATALAPILADASKPPVETIKTVLVDESGAPVAAPESDDASRVQQTTFGALWNAKRNKMASLPVSVWNAKNAPAKDTFFVPDFALLAKLTGYIENQEYVWLAGPAGSGKSTLPLQYAAWTGRPCLYLPLNRVTDPIDMFGTDGLKNGNTGWRDGVLTKAIRKPGTIVFFDEITSCPPGIAMTLQTLLSSRMLTLPTGEVVHCADGVTFMAADNTRGYGDETGLYAGTQQANAALVDRFAALLWVDYMPAAQESQALSNRTGAPRAACDSVVAFVNSARKLSGFDARPLSLRRMVAFVNATRRGFDVVECFDDSVLSRMPDAERETLRQHFSATFDSRAYQAALTGQTGGTVPHMSDAPEQVAARAGFPALDNTGE